MKAMRTQNVELIVWYTRHILEFFIMHFCIATLRPFAKFWFSVRLIISEVLDNLLENYLPYLKYSYKKYKSIRNKKKREKQKSKEKICFSFRVEKEYLKPVYSASISQELKMGSLTIFFS